VVRHPITVVLTCVGGLTAVEIIQAFFRHSSLPTRVVAVDMDENAVGQYYADAFYTVPSGKDAAFVDKLLEICRKERVQVVIPGSDEEAYSLARSVERFRQEGVVCTVPRQELVQPMSDKGAMYQWLGQRGVPVPKYFRVNSPQELREAAKALDYPKKSFIIKPSSSRGGRGVWQIHPEGISLTNLFSSTHLEAITLDAFLHAVESADQIPTLLAMEYLPGDAYDVDVLAREGEVLYMVPRRRFNPRGIPFMGCILEKHEGVLKLAGDIQEALSLTYLYDFDIALAEDGRPCLMEVNPRLSAGIVATLAAGINLMEYLVRMALDTEIPVIDIPYGKVVRASTRTVCVD